MNIFRKVLQDKKNYYNIVIAIFLGILFIILSESFFPKDKESNNQNLLINDENNSTYEACLERRLKEILKKAHGVGEIEVMITLENGKEIVTKDDISKEKSITNEEATNGDKREILSDRQQNSSVKVSGDEPLIIKEISPKISGVLIVAQGGGNIEVKNTLINATRALLGVDIHKIEVLKMK